MSFRIEWARDVLSDFATVWDRLDPRRQREVMDALDDIDRMLMVSPTEVGESRVRTTERVLIHLPVVVSYQVNLTQQVVRMNGVRVFWKEH